MVTDTPRRLIGLDPGLRFTGWGVIDMKGSKLTHVANGSVRSNVKNTLAERLVELEQGLIEVFNTYQPECAAVENSFVNRDGGATLKLGQARAISLLVPARLGLRVEEYAPNFIKRAVAGAGHADKHQMGAMVGLLLPKAKLQDEHATDALAVAITLAHSGDFSNRLGAALDKAERAGAVQ